MSTRARWSIANLVAVIVILSVFTARYYVGFRDTRLLLRANEESQLVVNRFFSLPTVAPPSLVSPFWSVRATARFEDAPIRIIEFADPLCSDCKVFFEQMQILKQEFAGKINLAYQFFPLDAKCNSVVEKDKHPGACDLSYMLAADPQNFAALHEEIHEHMTEARTEAWRLDFAKRHNLTPALTDTVIQALVKRIIETGTEYQKTSEKYAHGIRSTPTLIINGRMVIGTLPIEHMRAIFKALESLGDEKTFLENWIEEGCGVEMDEGIKPCS